ncbi:unnamed protein product, partial [Lymnaea stagnalis]
MSQDMKAARRRWEIPISKMADKTFNPIRSVVDTMTIEPHPDKTMITLSLGE